MPKSSKRNKVANEKKEIVGTVKKLAKRVKGKSKPPVPSGRGGPRRSIQESCQHNADCYLRCVMDPWKMQGVRIPSPVGYPSSTTSLFTRQFPALTGATTRWVGGLTLMPNLYDFSRTVTSSTAVNAVTWTSANHPKASSIATYAGLYRVVSLGFRLMDVGAMIDRGISLYLGRIPPTSGVSTVDNPTDLLDDITTSPNFELIDLAKMDADGMKVVWLPVMDGSMGYASGTFGVPTGSTYRAVTQDCNDSRICAFFVSTRADTPSDEVAVETVMNIEFIPNLDQQYLFETKTAPGGPTDVAHAITKISTNPTGQLVSKTGSHGNIDVLKEIWGTANSVRQYVTDAWEGLGGWKGISSMLEEFAPLASTRPPALKRYPSPSDESKAPPDSSGWRVVRSPSVSPRSTRR